MQHNNNEQIQGNKTEMYVGKKTIKTVCIYCVFVLLYPSSFLVIYEADVLRLIAMHEIWKKKDSHASSDKDNTYMQKTKTSNKPKRKEEAKKYIDIEQNKKNNSAMSIYVQRLAMVHAIIYVYNVYQCSKHDRNISQ